MIDSFDAYYQTCVSLVKSVDNELKAAFEQHSTKSVYKSDSSYVTSIDTTVESKLISQIKRLYPTHNIVAEESGEHQQSSAYTWRIDPLDGTSNFLFGIPLYGSMIAVEYDNRIVASAINLPSLSLLISASINLKTQINSLDIPNYPETSLDKTTLVTDSGKTKISKQRLSHYLSLHETEFRSVRRFGCAASHVAMLNSHQPFISLIVDAAPHDLCPMSLIFQQAGFKTINSHGQPWEPTDRDILSYHPSLDKEVRTTLPDLFV